MATGQAKHHDYHLVDPSPWPVVGSISAFVMALGAVAWMHKMFAGAPIVFGVGTIGVLYTMASWWGDVIREAQLSAEDFQRIYAVNTIGPFQMVRAARALLEASAGQSGRSSAVVNISSIAGIAGIGSSVAYAASKGALNTVTLSLSRALAPLIRVNAVCPGYIDTPWFTKGRGVEQAAKVRQTVVEQTPLKLATTAQDVAELVCFLVSPASRSMTGEIVRIDAGVHLGPALLPKKT